MKGFGYSFGLHIRQDHWKGKKRWVNCWQCWTFYSITVCFNVLVGWAYLISEKYNISTMEEIFKWILIVIGISIPPIIAVCLDYYFKRKKLAAETKKIQLQNKITEEINYDQLKKDNKYKDIKSKIEILSRINRLEEEIKNKTNKTNSDRKKIAALEMLKEEFKETLVEKNLPENKFSIEKSLLVKEPKNKKSKRVNKKE